MGRIKAKRVVSTKESEGINSNSNHIAVTKKRTNPNKIDVEVKANKKVKRKEIPHFSGINSSKIVFQEEQDTVQFEVENDEFENEVSDGEPDHDSEGEEGEINDDNESEVAEEMEQAQGTKIIQNEDQDIDQECEKQGSDTMKRKSVHDQIETLTSAVVSMQNLMMQKGFFSENPTVQPDMSQRSKKGKNVERGLDQQIMINEQNDGTNSETTIYHNAVQKDIGSTETVEVDQEISFKLNRLRDSTSSEEQGDTSGETMETEFSPPTVIAGGQEHSCRPSAKARIGPRQNLQPAEEVVRKAEAGKARMFATPGNEICNINGVHNSNDIIDSFLNQERGRCEAEKVAAMVSQSTLVDENYMTMETHLDKTMVDKIIAGEYIDFSKLLPRDKIMIQEDH